VVILSGVLLATLWLSGTVTAQRLGVAYTLVQYEFTSGSPERQAAGAELFHAHCSSCHGLEPAEAASLARQAFSKFGDYRLWRRIQSGPLPEDMPAFAGVLSSEEVLDVLAYLHKMRDLPAEAAPKSRPMLDGAYKYVALDGAIRVYDLDQEYAFVKQIRVKGQLRVRGIAANATTGRLYVSFSGHKEGVGGLACIDLATDDVLWIREYSPGADSLALSPDGKTIYMPVGEMFRNQDQGEWLIVDALSGDVRKSVTYGTGPHNTIVSPDGRFVYLAPIGTRFLGVLDTSSDEIAGQIGI
jgi:mono/diheme cytochrome c family protein